MKNRLKKSFSVFISALMLLMCSVPVGAVTETAAAETMLSDEVLAGRACGVDEYTVDISEEEEARIDAELDLAWEDYYESGVVCAEYQNSSYSYSSDYLYSQLTSEGKAFYQSMASSCEAAANNAVNFTSTVPVTNNSTGETNNPYVIGKFAFPDGFTLNQAITVASAFYYSNPQYFFVSQVAWSQTSIYLITYDGYENGAARSSAARQIDSITEQWLAEFSRGADDLEKEALIYKKICDSVTYHKDSSGNPVSSGSNQTIAGALLNKTCVCNGYTMTVTYFCHLMGIDCIGIVGNNHAWNAVKLNGSWYDLDVTWMDAYEVTGRYNYKYCNRGDGIFRALDSSGYHVPQEKRLDGVSLPVSQNDNPVFIPVTLSNASESSVRLEWETVYGSNGYGVYRYQNGAYYLISDITGYYNTSYTASGLDLSTPCGFYVRAEMYDPVSYEYVRSAFTSACIFYPEIKPVITKTVIGDGQIGLNWSAVPGAEKYAVYTYLNGKWTCAGTRTACGMYATGLINGVTYGFAVKAYVNGAWTSVTSSDIVYATPSAPISKPVITKTIIGDGQIGLNWTAVAGAENYAVYSYINGKWTLQGYRTTNGMYVRNLVNGIKYGFAVKAYVNGEWTNVTSSDIVYAAPNA